MKKLFAIVVVVGVLTSDSTQFVQAQDAAATEQAAPAADKPVADAVAEAAEASAPLADAEEEGGIHKEIRVESIEGTASLMSLVAIVLVTGLAFCIERIIYLSLAEINTKKFMPFIGAALEKGDVEAAKDIARNTKGPVASIYYQGLTRIDQDINVVEESVVSYDGAWAGYLEKGCSWITLFIAMAPSLGFLGTVVGMVMAFDKIQQQGDISPTVAAGGTKVALITTIFGLVVVLILQVFHDYILAKIEAFTSGVEDSSTFPPDMVIKYDLKYKKQSGMSKLTYKVPYYVLYAMLALIVVVLGLFYLGGQMETPLVYDMDNPANTDALLYPMYDLFGIAVVTTIVAAIFQFGSALKDSPKGAIRSLLGLILLVFVLVVAWSMDSGETLIIREYEGTDNVPFWLKLTDMFLYSIYFLLLVTVVAIIGSGIKKKLS